MNKCQKCKQPKSQSYYDQELVFEVCRHCGTAFIQDHDHGHTKIHHWVSKARSLFKKQ